MRRVVVPLLAALLGGAVGAGIVVAVDDDGDSGTRTVIERAPLQPGGDGLDAAGIYKRDGPGVVFVVAEVVEPAQSPFDFGVPEQRGE